MMGRIRSEGPAHRADDDNLGSRTQDLIVPTNYPPAGASIGQRTDNNGQLVGTATLAGFVEVDGTVYGLTNHHAIFGGDRMHPYNPLTEPKVIVDQPSEGDLTQVLPDFNLTIGRAEQRVPVASWVADMKLKRETCEKFLTSDVRELGSVHSSSGIRVTRARAGRRHRVDWALINVDQNRCPDQSLLVNQLPPCENLLHKSISSYVKTAGKTSYDSRPKDLYDFPEYLGNLLTWHNVLEKQDKAEDLYKNFIVWKHGRSSHFTWGITGAIESDYLWGDGVTKSDEWHIKDAPSGSGFSLKGDSGALVWDIDGAVVGMMWGGCFQKLVTYVTPIEAVLADIKETLGARDVRMVVRNPTRN